MCVKTSRTAFGKRLASPVEGWCLGKPTALSQAARRAFNLIELYTVISIIAVLSALLLTALSGARERAKLTKCLSNLRQAGFAFQMYGNDSTDRLPPFGHPPNYDSFQYGGADPDWRAPVVGQALPATNRALWPYTCSPEAFHCPSDRNGGAQSFVPLDDKELYQLTGASYKYNDRPWWDTRKPQADPVNGLAEKPSSWVPDPARFVLLHEWPALPLAASYGGPIWTVWHFCRGSSAVHSAAEVQQKVVSPVLFVDGHAAAHDFTAAVKSAGPAEPTADWIWYKPAP